MEKPGRQAQLIKTRILYCRSREKSVLVLLVTREIRIMYSKSRALQQLCDSFQGGDTPIRAVVRAATGLISES